jgi:hypothetical protein
MKRRWLAALVVLAGCGGGVVTTGPSCTGMSAGIHVCMDYVGGSTAELQQLQTACASNFAGTWSSGACSRSGSVGGCSATAGDVEVIAWLYSSSGVTSDQAKQSCAQANQNYVQP